MSSDTPFSVYGDVPEVQGIPSCSLKARYAEEYGVYPNKQQLAALEAKWHEKDPHTLSAVVQRSAKRARVGETKQGGGQKGNKHNKHPAVLPRYLLDFIRAGSFLSDSTMPYRVHFRSRLLPFTHRSAAS